MSYLPSLKPLVKRVKGKFHSNTLGVLKTSSKLKLPANNSSRTGELNPMYSRNLITEAMRSSW
ncbi:Hypothetical predicted protein [Marmota monax]|uniref:Uncharacterized protein n=1 Tax=Marmota monax TaxID=9995 RepID=A0A5E4A3N8_MARMO|nr:hypothetical protein GHT09_000188 [Marmota monax]VTJ51526.1 Hypothetical predicted protein [Marmota monax]